MHFQQIFCKSTFILFLNSFPFSQQILIIIIMKENAESFIHKQNNHANQISYAKYIYWILCPCMKQPDQPILEQKQYQKGDTMTIHAHNQLSVNEQRKSKTIDIDKNRVQLQRLDTMSFKQRREIRKANPVFLSSLADNKNKDDIIQYFQRRLSNHDNTSMLDINKYKEAELMAMGSNQSKKMLMKISSHRLKPSKKLLLKTKQNLEKEKETPLFSNPYLEKFWAKRYLIFERFDLGIKLDQESWYHALPQVVAEHIASRIQCQVVLDAFSGVGYTTIKFANTCYTVLACQQDATRCQYLSTNSYIYGVENLQVFNKKFLQLESIKADIVYISPPLSSLDRCENFNDCESLDPTTAFQPNLSAILQKALQISKNIVLLLPSNVQIEKLSSLLSSVLQKSDGKIISSSFQLQKIYFMEKLKYVCLYYGPQVNKEVKLGDELQYIYTFLKDGQEGIFEHKKVIKEIREKYGMVALLNWTYECQKNRNKSKTIEKFYELVKIKKLINLQKLNILIDYQNAQSKKIMNKKVSQIQEEKYQQRSQETNSYTTNQSMLSQGPKISEKSIEVRERNDSSKYLPNEEESPKSKNKHAGSRESHKPSKNQQELTQRLKTISMN